MTATFDTWLRRIGYGALPVGLVLLGLSVLIGWTTPQSFYQAYLFAYLFWLGVSLGALAIVMIHHLSGGMWGVLLRRPLEAALQLLPLLALLFIPLLFGMDELYDWARPDAAQQHALVKKLWYLNPPFFYGRMAFCFLVWLGLAWLLGRAASHGTAARLTRLSTIGLMLYTLTLLLASTDLVMSLVPEWYSTSFALLFGVGQMLSAMALAIAICAWITRSTPHVARLATAPRLNDLGNMLLMFVLTWSYLAFTQYLIIWYENLPPEIAWYVPRVETSWRWLALFVILFHFALPFALLLARRLKRNATLLGGVAAALLAIHAVEVFWVVMPVLRPQGITLHWLDVLLFLALGAVWMSAFALRLQGRALLPDPAARLEEASDDA